MHWNNSSNTTIAFAGYHGGSGGGNDFRIGTQGANDFTLHSNNVERMRITASGSVGIGTTAPSAFLHIVSSVTTTTTIGLKDARIILQNNTFTGGAGGEVVLGAIADTNIGRYASIGTSMQSNGSGGASGDVYIATKSVYTDTSLTPRLYIERTGNVGIGTSSPDTILTVYGANSSTGTAAGNVNIYTTTGYGANVGGSIGLGGYYNTTANIPYANLHGKKENATLDDSNGYFAISVRNSSAGTVERMRIGSTGFTASTRTASDSDSRTFINSINATCGLIPVPSGTTLYLYSRDAGVNYRVLLTSSAYFTGQHGNKPVNLDLKNNIENYIGMIVSSAGIYYSVNPITKEVTTGKDAISISEALPEIKLTNIDKDKSVWGVVTNVKNDNYNTDGTVETDNNTEWGDRLGSDVIRINGLGEGAVWVTNINGNIENGDYICSSVIPGYGRKQNDDLLHNYTVAKSTMNCDFDLNNDGLYICEEFQHDGTTYKKAFIGCTYHCS
jgi:hypothetical protein